MHAHATDPATIDRLGGDVFTHANRSIELLKAIETTVSSLCYDQAFYSSVDTFSQHAIDAINNSKPSAPIDKDGGRRSKLLEAQEAVHRLYELMIIKKSSAMNDGRLTAEDGVVDEYGETISAIADLHNSLNDLRWAIGEHDAALSEKGNGVVLRSPKEVEAYLDNLK